jgi:thioredoxin 1
MSTKIVTDKNIEEVMQNHQIILLDFWAGWCEPCKMFTPIYERIAAKYPDIFFGKVNTETEPILCEDFQIKSIPTLVILKEGTIIFSESGVIPEYALNNILKKTKEIDIASLDISDDNE